MIELQSRSHLQVVDVAVPEVHGAQAGVQRGETFADGDVERAPALRDVDEGGMEACAKRRATAGSRTRGSRQPRMDKAGARSSIRLSRSA